MQIEPGWALDFFPSSSYITICKIPIWYNKATWTFYVKCPIFHLSLLPTLPKPIKLLNTHMNINFKEVLFYAGSVMAQMNLFQKRAWMEKKKCPGCCHLHEMGSLCNLLMLSGMLTLAGCAFQPGCGSAALGTKGASASPVPTAPPSFWCHQSVPVLSRVGECLCSIVQFSCNSVS